MTLSHITTHKEQMLARLLFQYKGKPNIQKVIEVIAARYQALEDVGWDLATKRSIELGEGVQLDMIGKIIKQPRGDSADDEAYRLRLKARQKANQSSGTPEDILAVFNALLEGYEHLELTPYYPASLILRIDDTAITEALSTLYAEFLKASRLGGVGAYLQTSPTDDENTFTFAMSTHLTADFDPGASTMHVTSTAGFLDSGYLLFLAGDANQWRVGYTYKTPTTFEGCSHREGVAAGQSQDDMVCQQASPSAELTGAFIATAAVSIPIDDESAFPDSGYVVVGPQSGLTSWRIIKYDSKSAGSLDGATDTGIGAETHFVAGQIVAMVNQAFGLDGENFGGQLSRVVEA